MFDTYSLHIAHIVSSLVVTLFAWAIVWSSESMRGARQWAFGLTLHLPALVLFLLRGRAPDFQTIVMANTLLILGSLISLDGVLRFAGYKGASRRQAVLLGLFVLLFAGVIYWFTAVQDIAKPRAVLTHGILGLNGVIVAVAVYFSRLQGIGRPLFCLAHVFYAVVSVARITLICQSNSPGVWSNTNHEYYMLASIAAVTAMAFSFSVMVTDVLHMRLQQQHAELQNNLQCRETLEAMIHHDLHGPLMPILYNAEKLLADDSLTPATQTGLKDIVLSARRIKDTISFFLKLHQAEHEELPLTLTSVSVADLLQQLEKELNTLAQPHGLSVVIAATNTADARISIDEAVFFRALVNLAQNAMEASPRDGEITVTASRVNGSVYFVFQNQGSVPEEIRDRLFEKYVTSGKPRGKGMGAYSARLATEAHGGSVTLDTSIPDRTTITLSVPVAV